MGTPVVTHVVAGVVIKQQGRYLLVQEAQPKAYGLWNWPAGKVEEGYTIKETAIKEAKEETGFDVELIRELGIWQSHVPQPAKHAFEARIISGQLTFPKNEIMDARWYSRDEIFQMQDKLRDDWVLGAVAMMEEGR